MKKQNRHRLGFSKFATMLTKAVGKNIIVSFVYKRIKYTMEVKINAMVTSNSEISLRTPTYNLNGRAALIDMTGTKGGKWFVKLYAELVGESIVGGYLPLGQRVARIKFI